MKPKIYHITVPVHPTTLCGLDFISRNLLYWHYSSAAIQLYRESNVSFDGSLGMCKTCLKSFRASL